MNFHIRAKRVEDKHLHIHKNSAFNTPQPVVISKEKEAYQYWLALYKNFPKIERPGIGQKISLLFIDVLELTFIASYLPPNQKIIELGKIISCLDILKFFSQLAWENKLIPTAKYTELSQKLEEIGRMLGGWKNGLINKSKTPAGYAREKQ
jgi:hypothetical protein